VEFVVLAALAIVRWKLWTYGSDTGTFAQIVADAFGGMRNGVEAGSHFRYHWSPTLALLWPFVAATRSALPLQFVQAAATVLCAPVAAAIARPYAERRLADGLGLLTLLYPPLLALGFDEFHELGLFTPLVLGLVLCADRRKWIGFALCAIAAIGLREDAALTLVFFGVVLFAFGICRTRATAPSPSTPYARSGLRFAQARRNFEWVNRSVGVGLLDGAAAAPRALATAGGTLALGAASALALYYGAIAPRLGGWVPSHFYVYPFAAGPLALIASPFTHPLQFARAIFTFGRLTYVLEALVPLAFLPLRSWWALMALPGGAIVLLANSGYVWRMGDHYAALWIPWLLVATAIGLASLAKRRGERIAARWAIGAAALCAVFLIAFDPLHPLHYLHSYYANLAGARRAIACVPKDASLATHDEWFSKISAQRPNATIDRAAGVRYLVYALDYPNATFQARVRPLVTKEAARGEYRAICRYGNVVTYEATGEK
jgi:uncharacterized membrane protein